MPINPEEVIHEPWSDSAYHRTATPLAAGILLVANQPFKQPTSKQKEASPRNATNITIRDNSEYHFNSKEAEEKRGFWSLLDSDDSD